MHGISLDCEIAQDCWAAPAPGHPSMAAKPRPATLACVVSALAALALAALGGMPAVAQDSRGAPEVATGWGGNDLATAKSHMAAPAGMPPSAASARAASAETTHARVAGLGFAAILGCPGAGAAQQSCAISQSREIPCIPCGK